MSATLPDVNVLVALLDPLHVQHDRAHAWFGSGGWDEWLSSPTTQNGVLHVVSHPKYPNHQPIQVVMSSLRSLLSAGHHKFVPDSVSLLGASPGADSIVITERLATSAQVTDAYLLVLAVRNQARLASFDRRLVTAAVRGGQESLLLIP